MQDFTSLTRTRFSFLAALTAIGLSLVPFEAARAQSDQSGAEVEIEDSAGEEPLLPRNIDGPTLALAIDAALEGSELQALVEALAKEMTVAGEPVEGWSQQGVFLPEYLTDQFGSMAQYILFTGGSTPSITRYGDEPMAMPDDYQRYTLAAEPDLPVIERALAGFQDGFWLESTQRIVRVDNAICYIGAGGIALYTNRLPDTWSDEDMSLIVLLYGMAMALDQYDICTVYAVRDDGSLQATLYDTDGRPLTALNESLEPETVLPASKSAELIASSALVTTFLEEGDD